MKPTTSQGINAGAMREQIQLQKLSTVPDSSGELQKVWNIFAVVRAEVVRVPGREIWDAVERNARVPTTWKIRFLAGVLPQMRLINRGKVYNIVSAIDPTGRDEEIIITSQELVEETVS